MVFLQELRPPPPKKNLVCRLNSSLTAAAPASRSACSEPPSHQGSWSAATAAHAVIGTRPAHAHSTAPAAGTHHPVAATSGTHWAAGSAPGPRGSALRATTLLTEGLAHARLEDLDVPIRGDATIERVRISRVIRG